MVSKYMKVSTETHHTEKQNKAFSDYANTQHDDTKGHNNRANSPDTNAIFIEIDSIKKPNVIKNIQDSVYKTAQNIWR